MSGKEKGRMAPVKRVGAVAVVAVFMFTLLFTLLGNTAGVEGAAEAGTAEQVELLSKGDPGLENPEEEGLVLEPSEEGQAALEAAIAPEQQPPLFEPEQSGAEGERPAFVSETYPVAEDNVDGIEDAAEHQNMLSTAALKAGTGIIRYMSNGGSGSGIDDYVTFGKTYSLLTQEASHIGTRKNHKFMGWASKSNAYVVGWHTGTTYTLEESQFTNGELTLWAVWHRTHCTISYDPNGGSGTIADEVIILGHGIGLSDGANFTRPGYKLKGWAYSPTGEVKHGLGAIWNVPNGDYRLYAVWEKDETPPAPSEYTITYKANGGSGSDYVVKVPAGGSHTVLHASDAKQSPPKGYTFRGWSTSTDPSYTEYVCGTQIKNIQQDYVLYMTYYATPAAREYTLIYMPNGGTGTQVSETVLAGTAVTLRGTDIGYTREGYVLVGWNTTSSGNGTSYKLGQTVTMNSGLFLYAVWEEAKPTPKEHTITYDANGGNGAKVTQTAQDGASVALKGSNIGFTRSGYTLTGWNTAANGTGTSYSLGQTIKATSDLSLYAVWKASTPPAAREYKIFYYPMGGKGDIITDVVKPGESITVRGAEIGYTREGYVLVGWNSVPGGNGRDYSFGQTITPTDNMFMCAVWEVATPSTKEYTISYHPNGGTGNGVTDKVQEGAAVTLRGTDTGFTRQGYVLAGWNTVPAGTGTSYSLGQTIKANGDMVLFAVWKESAPSTKEYVLLYDPNGGTGRMILETVLEGDSVTLRGTDIGFTREGYVLAGWNTMRDGRGTSYNIGQTITLTANLGLFAVWEEAPAPGPNEYTITYKANGGTGADYVVKVAAGENHKILHAADAKMSPPYSHAFRGWSKTPTPNMTDYVSGYYINNVQQDYVLYMTYYYYQPQNYAIIYLPNGGTGTNTLQNVTVGSTVTLHGSADVDFTRPGYVLTGWMTMDGTGERYSLGQTITVSRSMILFAVWESECTITYNANGGNGTITPQTVPLGVPVSLSKGDEFTRYQHDLIGWNTMPDGSGTNYSPGQTITPTESMTLYAVWEPWST